eukprot:352749-Chlamydomonas_euryale.AAC.8
MMHHDGCWPVAMHMLVQCTRGCRARAGAIHMRVPCTVGMCPYAGTPHLRTTGWTWDVLAAAWGMSSCMGRAGRIPRDCMPCVGRMPNADWPPAARWLHADCWPNAACWLLHAC